MLNPAVALEAYKSTSNAKEMRHPDWDEYYFGSDYDPAGDAENYNEQPGRKLWTVEWHTLFEGTADERKNLSWRDRFKTVGDSVNVIQYFSSGEEVLIAAEVGAPSSFTPLLGYLPFNDTPTGLNAWNIQEKAKGTANLAAFLAGDAAAGWGFRFIDESDPNCPIDHPIRCTTALLPRSEAEAILNDEAELRINPFFKPFQNLDLFDVSVGSAAVKISFPHNLAYELPALSFAAGGTESSTFLSKNNTVDMNTEMADDWPAARGGKDEKAWRHSDFKEVSYRYTFKLFDHLVVEGDLK